MDAITRFCLESKIRHSTVCGRQSRLNEQFCLESKIRHSTVKASGKPVYPWFCLESKIRHSTVDTVPYFYVQRLIEEYSVRYCYQKSIC